MNDFFQRNFKEWSTIIAALILGVCLIIGTVVVANMVTYVKTFNESQLAVTGSAQLNVTSDQVKWAGQFSVSTQFSDLNNGYTQMAQQKAKLLDFFQKNGVPAQDVTVGPVMTNPTYPEIKYNPQAAQALGKDALTEYTLSQTVVIQSDDVNKITDLSQDVGSLIGQGVNFTTSSLEYYYTKLPQIRAEITAKAVEDAQARAERIAKASGVTLGPLVSVNSGVLQLTPVNSTQTSDEGTYDTTTIQKTLTAVVRASFKMSR